VGPMRGSNRSLRGARGGRLLHQLRGYQALTDLPGTSTADFSACRTLWQSACMILWTSDAVWSNNFQNSRCPKTNNRIGVVASTVAERGSPSSRLISPKKSPGLNEVVRPG
jgi:hypothetical protein